METLIAMRIFNFILTRAQNVLPGEKLATARETVLKNCDFVVDIGSNSGQWISEIKSRGYEGAALCIEPLEKNFTELKRRKFHNTTILNCAVGNKNGYTYMNRASNNGLSSSILELDDYHKDAAPEIKFIGKEKVKIMKLSKILEKNMHEKIFVKIDTQGFEIEVLKSINKKTFNHIYGLEIETNIVSTYKNAALIEDVIKFLRKKGFRPLRLENGFGMSNFGQQLQVDILFVRT
jgi:FkbM family methyltransferase